VATVRASFDKLHIPAGEHALPFDRRLFFSAPPNAPTQHRD